MSSLLHYYFLNLFSSFYLLFASLAVLFCPSLFFFLFRVLCLFFFSITYSVFSITYSFFLLANFFSYSLFVFVIPPLVFIHKLVFSVVLFLCTLSIPHAYLSPFQNMLFNSETMTMFITRARYSKPGGLFRIGWKPTPGPIFPRQCPTPFYGKCPSCYTISPYLT
jgi:hypothetical protein